MAAGDVGLPPDGRAGEALEVVLLGHEEVAAVVQQDRREDDVGVGLRVRLEQPLRQRVGTGDVHLVGPRLPVRLGQGVDLVVGAHARRSALRIALLWARSRAPISRAASVNSASRTWRSRRAAYCPGVMENQSQLTLRPVTE